MPKITQPELETKPRLGLRPPACWLAPTLSPAPFSPEVCRAHKAPVPLSPTPFIPEAWSPQRPARLCLVAFLHSPCSHLGPSHGPGPLQARAEALRGLRSPAPSPAALNKNLIKCRGRPPPGLGRPDHRAGFLLQTAWLGLGRRACAQSGH